MSQKENDTKKGGARKSMSTL